MDDKEELRRLINESKEKDRSFFGSGFDSLENLKTARFITPIISLSGFVSIFLDNKSAGINEIQAYFVGIFVGIFGIILSIIIWKKYGRLKRKKQERDKRIEYLLNKLK